jgi:hypothetical protein
VGQCNDHEGSTLNWSGSGAAFEHIVTYTHLPSIVDSEVESIPVLSDFRGSVSFLTGPIPAGTLG